MDAVKRDEREKDFPPRIMRFMGTINGLGGEYALLTVEYCNLKSKDIHV